MMVTDEMVEAAARAIVETWAAEKMPGLTWAEVLQAEKELAEFPALGTLASLARREARAALAAAEAARKPDLVPGLERAREILRDIPCDRDERFVRDEAVDEIAAEIVKLLSPPGGAMTAFVIEGPVEFGHMERDGCLWLMALVEAPMDMPRGRKCPLIGADVTIQGLTHRCTGVEAHQPNRQIAKGEKLWLRLGECVGAT